ncbi:CDC16 [Candida jiufengensis]|uniref:CDC16 n=1 Tax=Candida jiufengensis TaxID=497108 RepID=UPI0022256999|nr:CDC16 [Candida jiufengensis]KAI5954964.1 CDC16 [Candida jiufengensis]
MVQNQKTPQQHNSTLFISPMLNRKKEIFKTPPNPTISTSKLHHTQPNKIFETPGSTSNNANNSSSFFNLDKTSNNLINKSDDSLPNQNDLYLTPIEKLRLWRHDSIMQHQLKTAEFLGDKILDLTNDSNDAFWLAQVFFNQGNYLRCKELILSNEEYSKSIICRYLAGYSLIKLELYDEALDIIGENNPFESYDKIRNDDGGVKLESSMCYLRGLIYSSQNNFERAKECYKEALLVDVKCYEAFNELIVNNFMTPKEEWEFITTQLNFREMDNNDELIKLLYTTKLNKYLNIDKFNEAEMILRDEYDLSNNIDLMISKSDYLYIQCEFDNCLSVCEKILEKDKFNFNILPTYLSCLYELGGRNKLFYKSHQLVEFHSNSEYTWLAIGTYYLSINKILEARKFFNKATIINPNFGQAWIGFAHTFAAEGEHEQAISAYAFASRLFPGTHLPNLFLGMQHLQMNNLNLSEEYLMLSYEICSEDPLLLNEIGVLYFHKNQFEKSEFFLHQALIKSQKFKNLNSKTWISINTNLGHVYRKSNQPYKALDCLNQILLKSSSTSTTSTSITSNSKNDSNILTSMGLINLKLGNYFEAIENFNDSLALNPLDPITNDLLKRALEINKLNSFKFLEKYEKIALDSLDIGN